MGNRIEDFLFSIYVKKGISCFNDLELKDKDKALSFLIHTDKKYLNALDDKIVKDILSLILSYYLENFITGFNSKSAYDFHNAMIIHYITLNNLARHYFCNEINSIFTTIKNTDSFLTNKVFNKNSF